MKTLNEQIDRIKSVMGLIMEQDDVYSNFLSQGFFNCRGIKLRIHGDDSYGGGGGGGSQKQISNWEDLITPFDKGTVKQMYKEFTVQNPQIKNVDFKYFTALQREADRIARFNERRADFVKTSNESMFLSDGKTFNGNMKDVTAYSIDQMLRSGDSWFFYWKKLFGNTNPTILDIYKHIESIGGKSEYEKLSNRGYDGYKTNIDLMNAIAKAELEKQKK